MKKTWLDDECVEVTSRIPKRWFKSAPAPNLAQFWHPEGIRAYLGESVYRAALLKLSAKDFEDDGG